jgi:acetyl-CoA C-acetyltransferase
MDAIISAASRIALGHMDSALAGGAESMSVVPVYLKEKLSRALVQSAQAKTLKDKIQAWGQIGLGDLKLGFPGVVEATTGMSMGQHCELMAKEWKISRADQDQLAYESHQKAAAAYSRGFYTGLIHSAGKLDKDNIVRGDTNLERLAKLKPVFDPSESGTLTAGNSSALTDGASIVLLGSETFVKERGYERLAYLTEFQNAAVNIQREGLLMAPTVAVGQMLKRAGLELQDFDFYEIHEAFAAQVLCTLKAWESDEFCQKHLGRKALGSIDRSKMNVAGGSLALGHPFAATGARIVATAAKLLAEKGRGRCLISICTGGGMATTAILERP